MPTPPITTAAIQSILFGALGEKFDILVLILVSEEWNQETFRSKCAAVIESRYYQRKVFKFSKLLLIAKLTP
jgi:hypothetical protein